MGNGIVVGHLGTDHDGFPPTPVTAGSSLCVMMGFLRLGLVIL